MFKTGATIVISACAGGRREMDAYLDLEWERQGYAAAEIRTLRD